MTNKGGGSIRHGGNEINQRRRKSGDAKRRNKARAAIIREANRAAGLNC